MTYEYPITQILLPDGCSFIYRVELPEPLNPKICGSEAELKSFLRKIKAGADLPVRYPARP